VKQFRHSSVFSYHYSTAAPHTSSSTCSSYQDKRAKPENLPQSKALSQTGEQWREKYFHTERSTFTQSAKGQLAVPMLTRKSATVERIVTPKCARQRTDRPCWHQVLFWRTKPDTLTFRAQQGGGATYTRQRNSSISV
jgi:hypothetical protein